MGGGEFRNRKVFQNFSFPTAKTARIQKRRDLIKTFKGFRDTEILLRSNGWSHFSYILLRVCFRICSRYLYIGISKCKDKEHFSIKY